MTAAISLNDTGDTIVAIAAVLTGIVVIFRFFGAYILAPYARRQDEKADDRLDLKLSPLVEELSTIRGEVTYNGGGSLKDAVRRTERRLDRMEGRFDEHDRFTRGGYVDDMEEPA